MSSNPGEAQGVVKVEVPRPVPVEMWGKDHWSTFGYIETRCVDHDGVPDREHMRCDTDLHPGLAGTQIQRWQFRTVQSRHDLKESR